MKKYIIIVFGFLASFTWSQNNELFEKANALYNDGKYQEAIDTYEQILKSDAHSAELYFNLANAHYKLNHIAPSIYNYEKALLLNPNDKEIANNLNFAQNMTIDAIQKVPEVGFSRLLKNLVNKAEADTWAVIAVIGVVLFTLLFLMYHFAYASTHKRIAFVASLLSLPLACFSVAMAFQKSRLDKKNNPAIVFTQESRVKTDPNKLSEELFRLHEGTKVQVLESYNNWHKIQLSDNTTGWLVKSDVKLLK
jgi:tetratricopeptide (TPR) repeat protein